MREEIAHPAAGLIDGFDEIFQADGFGVDAHALTALDVGVRWLLHAARSALSEARVPVDAAGESASGAGVIIGNLSYPSRGLTRYALSVWGATNGSEPAPDPRLRSVSALPARVLADAVGFGDAFALDAACASSLYAIKLACDRLHDGDADLMLAGGVNAADNLFLHTGFTALAALSRTGRSRPFHPRRRRPRPRARARRSFALKRLADAARRGTPVLGVIRGVGLSNDGRGARRCSRPAAKARSARMRLAYAVERRGARATLLRRVPRHRHRRSATPPRSGARCRVLRRPRRRRPSARSSRTSAT